jgi:hypothetical protein
MCSLFFVLDGSFVGARANEKVELKAIKVWMKAKSFAAYCSMATSTLHKKFLLSRTFKDEGISRKLWLALFSPSLPHRNTCNMRIYKLLKHNGMQFKDDFNAIRTLDCVFNVGTFAFGRDFKILCNKKIFWHQRWENVRICIKANDVFNLMLRETRTEKQQHIPFDSLYAIRKWILMTLLTSETTRSSP